MAPEDPQLAQSFARTITEVSERASLLVREEIELAKAEIVEKATKLAKGAAVGVAAGIFGLVALFFFLEGLAWLISIELFPSGTYFWGFFVVAFLLLLARRRRRVLRLQGGRRRAADAEDGDRRGAQDPRRRAQEEGLMAEPDARRDPRVDPEATARPSPLSVVELRGEVAEITDWRKQLRSESEAGW